MKMPAFEETDFTQYIVMIFALLAVLFSMLLFLVFSTGTTFGQICEKEHRAQSAAWAHCVRHLATR